MKFLVIWKSFENITQEQARPLRAECGYQSSWRFSAQSNWELSR
jgi:hypothetical protein